MTATRVAVRSVRVELERGVPSYSADAAAVDRVHCTQSGSGTVFGGSLLVARNAADDDEAVARDASLQREPDRRFLVTRERLRGDEGEQPSSLQDDDPDRDRHVVGDHEADLASTRQRNEDAQSDLRSVGVVDENEEDVRALVAGVVRELELDAVEA